MFSYLEAQKIQFIWRTVIERFGVMCSLFILLRKKIEEVFSSTSCQWQVPHENGKVKIHFSRAPEHSSLGEVQAGRGRQRKDYQGQCRQQGWRLGGC